MSIVSSVIASDDVQIDGRRYIREVHTDHVGVEHVVMFLAPADWNAQLAMTARVPTLETSLRDAEIADNIADAAANGQFATITLIHSTSAQNGAAVRAAYQSMSRTEAIFVGEYLSTLSDATLRNIFGMTQTQVNNLRATKLTPAANLAASIRAATGA